MYRQPSRRVRIAVAALSLSLVIGSYAVGTATGAVDLAEFNDQVAPPNSGAPAFSGGLNLDPQASLFPSSQQVPLAITGAAIQVVETDGPGEGSNLAGETPTQGVEVGEPLGSDALTDPTAAGDPAAAGESTEPGEPEVPALPTEPEEPEWEPLPWDINRGPNWTDRVLLTFDDCMNDPDQFIAVLDHATSIDVGLLIFPTGNCVMMYRSMFDLDLLQLIRERGHWVGHHSMSHPDLTTLGQNTLIAEITGNVESNLLRPPFGAFNQRVIDAAISVGKSIVYWSLDTNDWRGGSEQSIIDFVVENAQPSDNVLMHLQHAAFSANALTQIQSGLAERGLRVCRPAPAEQRPTPAQVPGNIC